MVYENKIPIENKKPIETVYEIKNEVPSFEEFMKTYENDANLNYDDLSGGSVGETNNYGPCGDYRCYGSNACQSGERFFTLYSPCPAAGCSDEFQTATHWVHAKDGCGYSNDKISNKFRIRCPDCFNTSHVKYHRFRCPAHPVEKHKSTYWYTSSTTFLAAFAMVRDSIEIPDDVYDQMLKDLRKPENRWKAESND